MRAHDMDAYQWKEGETTSYSKTITEADLCCFEDLAGEESRLQAEATQRSKPSSERRCAPSLLVAGLVSDVIGNRIPADVRVSHSFSFLSPVYVGDTVTILASIGERDREQGRMLLETVCRNQSGIQVVTGRTEIKYR